jgi:selenocysteine lyase/cysteine desulfurase
MTAGVNASVARIRNGWVSFVDRYAAEVLSARLSDGGRARGLTQHGTTDIARKTANTAFVVDDAHAIESIMRSRGVLASARGPVIRLAPHFYNTIDDIDTALDLLAELTRA